MKHGTVLLADAHAPMLEGVRSILEEYFEVVVMVAHQNALLAAIDRLDPEVAVIDVSFPPSGKAFATLMWPSVSRIQGILPPRTTMQEFLNRSRSTLVPTHRRWRTAVFS